jgi:hypothetical protein
MLNLLAAFFATVFTTAVGAATFQFPHIIEQDKVKLELYPRSPNQIAAFYEARGFPAAMIDILKQQCFITVRIHNQRKQLLWLELVNWQFSVDGKPIQRLHRDSWKRRWREMDMPLNSQSTFRWTLLPETLDYLPDEQESGNLILPRVTGKLTLDARFASGKNKQGDAINIHYDALECATDE